MARSVGTRSTPWKTILLLCGKCARKLDGGFGPKGNDTLKAIMRTELSARDLRRQVRIIETRCMGICPKKAVTALNASAPGTLLTVPRKTPAAEALTLLMQGDRQT
jgi:predicted metal-binding protein